MQNHSKADSIFPYPQGVPRTERLTSRKEPDEGEKWKVEVPRLLKKVWLLEQRLAILW